LEDENRGFGYRKDSTAVNGSRGRETGYRGVVDTCHAGGTQKYQPKKKPKKKKEVGKYMYQCKPAPQKVIYTKIGGKLGRQPHSGKKV